jgi:hypothetical protein
MLSAELLAELERRWRAQHVPWVERWAEGLSVSSMDELTVPLGLRLPTEARVWWRWHNGVPAERCPLSRDREMGGPGFQFLPLDEAVEQYRSGREITARAFDGDADRGWPRTWLPITVAANGTVVVCNCAGQEGEPAPIYNVRWDSLHEPPEPAAPSFGEMVTWWIDAFDLGAWRSIEP